MADHAKLSSRRLLGAYHVDWKALEHSKFFDSILRVECLQKKVPKTEEKSEGKSEVRYDARRSRCMSAKRELDSCRSI